MNPEDRRRTIQERIKAFASESLRDAGRELFRAMGYASDRPIDLKPNTAAEFVARFDRQKTLNRGKALFDQWRSVDFLFQLTDEHIRGAAQASLEFDSHGEWDGAKIESYLGSSRFCVGDLGSFA